MDAPPTTIGHQAIGTEIDIPRCFDLYNGPRDYYLEFGVPLYRAAMEGDWKTAKGILEKHPNLATALLDHMGRNVLHVAANTKHGDYNFIEKLMADYMTPTDLALGMKNGSTAFAVVASCGNLQVAKLMVQKNESLPLIRDDQQKTPLLVAIFGGRREMAWFLLSVTDLHQLSPAENFMLLRNCVMACLFDVAVEVLDRFPNLALHEDGGTTALQCLNYSYMMLKSHSTKASWWTKWTIYLGGRSRRQNKSKLEDEALNLAEKLWLIQVRDGMHGVWDRLLRELLFAVTEGNIDFIGRFIGILPSLISAGDQHTIILSVAILFRQAEVFNLIYETSAGAGFEGMVFRDGEGNSPLHIAAMMPIDEIDALNVVSGAALQMQRELLWYKVRYDQFQRGHAFLEEVESLTPPLMKETTNNAGDNPRRLFTKTHQTLRKEGEKWMKTTATSCSVVATLVTTVTFTAAFTVPGGNDQVKGTPIFQHDPIFMAFAIIDALSLFSSSIAILMFLGILTSRYAEEDFLKSLPLRLLVGLSTLFFSIAFMMVAFTLTFFIIFQGSAAQITIPILVVVLIVVPVVLFAFQEFPLLVDIYRSTYEARYLFRPKKHKIFGEKKNGDDHILKRLALKCLGKYH